MWGHGRAGVLGKLRLEHVKVYIFCLSPIQLFQSSSFQHGWTNVATGLFSVAQPKTNINYMYSCYKHVTKN